MDSFRWEENYTKRSGHSNLSPRQSQDPKQSSPQSQVKRYTKRTRLQLNLMAYHQSRAVCMVKHTFSLAAPCAYIMYLQCVCFIIYIFIGRHCVYILYAFIATHSACSGSPPWCNIALQFNYYHSNWLTVNSIRRSDISVTIICRKYPAVSSHANGCSLLALCLFVGGHGAREREVSAL